MCDLILKFVHLTLKYNTDLGTILFRSDDFEKRKDNELFIFDPGSRILIVEKSTQKKALRS